MPREATATDAVIDIWIKELSREAIRARFTAGEYGKVNPHWIAGWLKLRDG